MERRLFAGNAPRTTKSRRSRLARLARYAVLAGALLGCAHADRTVEPPAAHQLQAEPGLSAGDTIFAILLSDGHDVVGALQLKAADIDDQGVDLDLFLSYGGSFTMARCRVDFDGSRSGDLRVLDFFGGKAFRVEKRDGRVVARFQETILDGLESFEVRGRCPVMDVPGVACT